MPAFESANLETNCATVGTAFITAIQPTHINANCAAIEPTKHYAKYAALCTANSSPFDSANESAVDTTNK